MRKMYFSRVPHDEGHGAEHGGAARRPVLERRSSASERCALCDLVRHRFEACAASVRDGVRDVFSDRLRGDERVGRERGIPVEAITANLSNSLLAVGLVLDMANYAAAMGSTPRRSRKPDDSSQSCRSRERAFRSDSRSIGPRGWRKDQGLSLHCLLTRASFFLTSVRVGNGLEFDRQS
jgi:hypothetical protein